MTDRMKAIYDKLAQEGGGTWATYIMMDIEEALAAQQDRVRGAVGLEPVLRFDTGDEAMERLETEIRVAIDAIEADVIRYGWEPDDCAWQRAFGQIAGLHQALEFIKAQRRS